jgi:ABC-type transport system involved in multi-copper enzyme maturation permease subunit
MYAWKCWRETRASFFFLLILNLVPAILFTLAPGIKEQNGWWSFDRREYTHDPALMVQTLSTMILSVVFGSGFLAGAFLGATASGSELDSGTIEYLWTRPRPRATFTWMHWAVCVGEIILITTIPTYLAAALLGILTGNWNVPMLLTAPWLLALVGLPMLGLTTAMTAVRRSAKGGLVFSSGIVVVYVVLRRIAVGPLHLNLPPLFSGPIRWLFLYYTREHMLFPWGSFTIAIVFAILFPLAAQYLLQRTEV